MQDTREPSPDERPVALTVAGSDSGGGAGIQADLKTMEAHGVFGTSVLTAATAQHTRGVESTHVLPVEEVTAQLDAVIEDFAVAAAKTGMLATAPIVEAVADRAREFTCPLVVDPVMVATSGDRLLDPAAESAYEDLVATADVVTPNADEAAVLTGVDVTDEASAIEAGETLLKMGAESALVKGGHVPGDAVRDVYVTAEDAHTFENARVATESTHGSGCALASAVAAHLARGTDRAAAVEAGVEFLQRAVRYSLDVGRGPGSVHHLVELRNDAARDATAEAVEDVVAAFVERDVSALVPEVGMNVVGATPYAEAPEETAAVEGRITRTMSGVAPNRGVRFGASSHVARFLLAAREEVPRLRFAVNCRFDDEVETALAALDGPVAEFDREEEPAAVKAQEGSTMQWGARQAFGGESDPVAVVDRGEVGKEAIVKLVAADAATLRDRTFSVLSAL
jgi:hydroxymethylpyrimidine kinase/phosphomethylpyrimidine kinase